MKSLYLAILLAAAHPLTTTDTFGQVPYEQELTTFDVETRRWTPTSPIEDSVALAMDHAQGKQRVEQLIEQEKLSEALEAIDTLLEGIPTDGDLWLQAGSIAYGLSEYERAIGYYVRAVELGAGWDPVAVVYNTACCYSLIGDTDNAFLWLDRAMHQRFVGRQLLATDTDLDLLRDDLRWPVITGLSTSAPSTPEDAWRQDIAYLQFEIARLGFDLGQGIGTDAAVEKLQQLADSIGSIPELHILPAMHAIVAQLGDGHSFVWNTADPAKTLQLPILFYSFPDGLFVTHAEPGFEQWIGHEVASIGNSTPDEALPLLSGYAQQDNPMGALHAATFYASYPIVLSYLGLVDDIDQIPLVLVSPNGTEHEVSLTPVLKHPGNPPVLAAPAGVEPPLWLSRTSEPFFIETVRDGLLYVQFNMVQNAPDESLADFADRLRARINDEQPLTLVVDVRHNGGGNGTLNPPFLNAIIHLKNVNPDAQVLVLTSRTTFSAAQNFVTALDQSIDVTFVGEPTGSRPNMVGESEVFTLPNSGALANISCRYHQTSRYRDNRIWIAPDIPVYLTAKDFFAGRDPLMELIAEMAPTR